MFRCLFNFVTCVLHLVPSPYHVGELLSKDHLHFQLIGDQSRERLDKESKSQKKDDTSLI